MSHVDDGFRSLTLNVFRKRMMLTASGVGGGR